ncbi:MAG: hypothetical protein QOH42_2198 [Blastocatellia bacterium]|nr:hypothetical protein [Blastocatellia bacterium]
MRRCPVCDFIYEDDEKLCAMDGTALVNHSGPLAWEESALPQSPQSPPPTNSHGRGLTLIASGVILAIALFLYFHNVSRRNVLPSNPGAAKTYNPSQPGDQNPVAVIPIEAASPSITSSPAFNVTPPKTDAPSKSYRVPQPDGNSPFRTVPVETATPLPRPLPSFTPARAKIDVSSDKSVTSPVKPSLPLTASVPSAAAKKDAKPTDNNPKNESKITSFLKKAGRVLKKPFKH